MKSLFLEALNCSNKEGPPVWLMRQAGRYLPEYRKIREKYSFNEMYRTPDIAAEVTLQPITRFGMDAAILFSDILSLVEALGLGLHFKEGKGPVIERPLQNDSDVFALPKPDIEESLGFIAETIRLVKSALNVPLIGFCGGPFTVASYMIEGGSSRELTKTKQWMLRHPSSFHQLLSHLAELSIDYLNLQIRAGVQAIQIFDSWAQVLSRPHFCEFSLHYLTKIINGIKNSNIPVILFCRGSSVFLKDLIQAGPQGISLDWNIDIHTAREQVPASIALQGNLDPDILYAPPHKIKEEVKRLLNAMKHDSGYIFNLGHGIKPDVPIEAVETLVNTIKHDGP